MMYRRSGNFSNISANGMWITPFFVIGLLELLEFVGLKDFELNKYYKPNELNKLFLSI
jgi:hypothetical protein